MRRTMLSLVILITLILPVSATAQSGDATWLNGLEGLQTGIGRTWMAPISFIEVTTQTDINEEGTPFTIGMRGEPSASPSPSDSTIITLSALVFEFDTAEHAQAGLDILNDEQVAQIERDPRSPAINSFSPDDLGDVAYGHEGTFAAPMGDGSTMDMAVVYLMVQDGPLVYQIFGQFLPGTHIEQTTAVAHSLVDAEPGSDAAAYDMNGASSGDLWEKLNGVQPALAEGSTVNDLQIYPPADDATMGGSVVVPEIDLANVAAIPGLAGSWHIAYAAEERGTPAATPATTADGVFSIEVWVMEFTDATYASAAAFSLDAALTEPLGIVTTEGSSFDTGDGSTGITLVNTGFVRDRALPEGDAATVVQVSGTTVIAARVYANGEAPTPIAQNVIASIAAASPGSAEETITATEAHGGVWDRFPAAGDDVLHGLVPVVIRHDDPLSASTPVG